MNGRAAPSYHILHRQPGGLIEALWWACLADADFPTHYTAPEYFSEPGFRNKGPFAVLSLSGEEVTAVLTGTNEGAYVQSGLSVRPQIVFSRRADRVRALANMVDGLLVEAGSAKLVDLFVWSDVATLVDPRFRKKQYEGVAMLDLSRGPDALFRKFSENKRRNIKRAIKGFCRASERPWQGRRLLFDLRRMVSPQGVVDTTRRGVPPDHCVAE